MPSRNSTKKRILNLYPRLSTITNNLKTLSLNAAIASLILWILQRKGPIKVSLRNGLKKIFWFPFAMQ